jgi:hypothetical protein
MSRHPSSSSDIDTVTEWGDGVGDRIADDLREATGGARGFSRRNLFYMRRFASLWPDAEKVQTLSAQIGWSHHQVLLDAPSSGGLIASQLNRATCRSRPERAKRKCDCSTLR